MRNYLLSAADRAGGVRAGIRGSEIESVAKGKEFEILKIFFSLEVLVFTTEYWVYYYTRVRHSRVDFLKCRLRLIPVWAKLLIG